MYGTVRVHRMLIIIPSFPSGFTGVVFMTFCCIHLFSGLSVHLTKYIFTDSTVKDSDCTECLHMANDIKA